MLKHLKLIFTPPTFVDIERTNIARHLYLVTWLAIFSSIAYLFLLPVLAPQLIGRIIWIAILLVIQIFIIVTIRKGFVKQAAIVSLGGIWLIFAITTTLSGGIISVPYSGNFLIVLSAAILLGWRVALLFALLSIFEGAVLVWAEIHGLLPPLSTTPLSALLLQTIYLLVGGGTLHFATFSIKESLEKSRKEIKEHQKTQTALQLSEARYRNFIEQSIDGIWMLVFDQPIPTDLPVEEQVRRIQNTGYIADSNDAIARMYGYNSSHEFIGTRLLKLYGDRPSEINFHSTLQLVKSGYRSGNRLTEEVTKDGYTVYFLNNAVGIIKNGCLVELWGTQKDITELKKAEQALKENESRQRALLDAFPDMIFELDRQGVFANFFPAKDSETYVPTNQFIRRSIRDTLPESIADLTLLNIDKALETGEVQTFEYQLEVGGSLREYEARLVAVNEQSFLAIVRDITDRKRLVNELETRNAELERFTYTVSHDLKTPLVTMRGFLGFLARDIQAENTEQINSDIARISDAADRMQRLLNELLDLSRIGRVMNPSAPVPFERIVREALDALQTPIQARNVKIEIAPDLPIIYGDHVRLVEVVQNLVDNACKFMGNQSAPVIQIGLGKLPDSGETYFYVRDNGIGVEPQYHDVIFGLFNKLDSSSDGTGIGLALVKRIIEVHGGRIWVESEGSYRGSTFYFTLPTKGSKL